MRPRHVRNHLSLQYNLRKKTFHAQSFLCFPHAIPLFSSLPSRLTSTTATYRHTNRCSHLFLHTKPPHTATQIVVLLSSFTPNFHHRHTDRPPELTATNFAEAMRGAWKQTVAAVSHDPKVCFSWFSLFPNLDFELGVRNFCLLHRKVSNFEHFLFDENGGWVYFHKEDLKRRYYTATGEVPS